MYKSKFLDPRTRVNVYINWKHHMEIDFLKKTMLIPMNFEKK